MYLIFLFVFMFGILFEVTGSNYILHFSSGKEHLMSEETIKLPKAVKSSLKKEVFLVLTNPENPASEELSSNILQTLTYMDKQTEETSVSELPINLEKYSGIIVTFEEINLVPNLAKITDYVAEGGSVFFATRPGLNDSLLQIYRKLGIYEVGDFTEAHGIKLSSNILINHKDLVIDDQIIENSSLAVGIVDSCRVHATSVNHVPLLWDTNYKQGRFIVFNGTMLSSKENRGLLAGSISLMKDDFIYPIMNMKIAHIDDFPAPLPTGSVKEIYNEHQMDTESFFQKVWWPFIRDGAKKYDVTYTGFLIQSYNDQVKGPFTNEDGVQKETLIKYGRDLLKMGGEIGVHGYNHQPLTTSQQKITGLGYNEWKNKQDMEESLAGLDKYVKSSFPSIKLNTYVPPSNILDETGLSAIHSALPSINVISSLYSGNVDSNTYVQEYESKGNFVHLPRITSGYEFKDETKWAMANSITSIGVFSHFIHPDDFLDEERTSKKSWVDLENEYNLMLGSIKEKFPWLRSMTTSEGAKTLQQFAQSDIYISNKKNKVTVYCDNFSGAGYFLLRTDKLVGKVKNGTANKIDDGVYLVSIEKEIVEIGLVK